MAEEYIAHHEDLPVNEEFEYGAMYNASEKFNVDNQQFVIIRFDPGDIGPLSYHDEPINEFYYILDGPIDIQLGEDIVKAKTGTVVHAPPGVPHRPLNEYDEPALMIASASPEHTTPENTTYVEDDRLDD